DLAAGRTRLPRAHRPRRGGRPGERSRPMKRPTVLIAVVALVVAAGAAWLLWGGSNAKPTTQQAVSGPYTVQFSADQPRIGGTTFTVAVTGPAPEVVTVAPV